MKINLGTRFTLYVAPIVAALILCLGVLVYILRYQAQKRFGEEVLQREKESLYSLLQMNYQERTNAVRIALQYAHETFTKTGAVGFDSLPVDLIAVNQITKSNEKVTIFPMKLGEKSLYQDYSLVDAIKSKANVTAAIFQRIPQGWLTIATNVLSQQGQRAINTYIPNDSPVALAVQRGLTYYGRAFVVSDWYITAYEPIWYNGKVEGMLYVGIPEKDIGYFSELIKSKKFLENGFAMLVNEDGKIMLSPALDTSLISVRSSILEMQKNKEGITESEDSKGNSYVDFYKYFEPFKCFVVTRAYKEDYIYKPLRNIIYIIAISISFVILLFIVIMQGLMKMITRPINAIVEIMSKLSKGIIPEKTNIKAKDEIKIIVDTTNQLIEGIKETAEFAQEIGKKNFEHEFKPLSNEDVLGNALLEMRTNLINAEKEEKKRDEEQEQRNWATQGIAKFAEILRQNNNDMKKLSFEIIKEMVKYLKMNQGGLFIVNDDDKNNIYLELMACYAYDRQKFLQKKIEVGEGLVGACYQEGLPIYMTDVPESYINITSGLGDAPPRCILIVPLKLNEEIYGVIELASFQKLKPYEIEFVEKVAESIAGTISSVKINIRTAYLLEKSQQQAEEMRAQEEEMRQNMEELQATQEEMARKNSEIQSIMTGINSSLPIIEFDKDERVINLNTSFTELTGLTLSDIKGMPHRNFVDKEYVDSGKYAQLWDKVRMGIPVTENFVHNIKNRTLYTSETIVPIKDNNGNILKVMMFFIDMTEQYNLQQEINKQLQQSKEMEEEMRQNLEELQATQEEMMRRQTEINQLIEAINKSSYYVEYAPDGKILRVNDVVKEKLGVSEADVIGKNHRDFVDFSVEKEADYALFWENLRNNKVVRKITHKVAKNRSLWLSETYTPMCDSQGKVVKIMNIAFDITEQKELELDAVKKAQEIAKREQYLQGLSNAVDAEYIRIETDLSGKMTFVNDTALRVTGKTREEMLRMTVKACMPYQIVSTGKFDQFWNELISGKPQKGGHQYNFEGKEVWLYCTYTPVKNEQGQIDRIIIIGNDITVVHQREMEAKKNLEELLRLKEELEKSRAESIEKAKKYRELMEKFDMELEQKRTEIEMLKKKLEEKRNNE